MNVCSLFLFSFLLGWCDAGITERVTPGVTAESIWADHLAPYDATSAYGRYRAAVKPCDVQHPPHAPGETGYRTYRTYEVYQLALFEEMCLSWYVMQQPKNHGIWLSRGAPNF